MEAVMEGYPTCQHKVNDGGMEGYLVFRKVVQARLLLLFDDRREPRLQKLGVLSLRSQEERRDLFVVIIRGDRKFWAFGMRMVRHDSKIEEPV